MFSVSDIIQGFKTLKVVSFFQKLVDCFHIYVAGDYLYNNIANCRTARIRCKWKGKRVRDQGLHSAASIISCMSVRPEGFLGKS